MQIKNLAHHPHRVEYLLAALLFILTLVVSSLALRWPVAAELGDLTYRNTEAFNGEYNQVNDTAIDSTGNTYMAGYFVNTSDFNPEGGSDERQGAFGVDSSFITKTNADGSYGWTKTVDSSQASDVEVDADGNVYVSGSFSGTTSFDLGGSGDQKTAGVGGSHYITRINADGSYGWTNVALDKPVDGYFEVRSFAVANDGTTFLTGPMFGTVNFNPGGGGNAKTSENDTLAVTRINADGSYGWTRLTGPYWLDQTDTDSAGNLYLTGPFAGTVDFNPEGGGDERIGNGGSVYVTRINADGSYGWTYTVDDGYGSPRLAVTAAGVFLADRFVGNVDFDPSPSSGPWQAYGTQGRTTQQLDIPGEVAFDGVHNKVYVAQSYNGKIFRMDSGTGGTTLGDNWESFGEFGSDTGQFDEITGIAIDETANRLYVSDNGNQHVSIFDTGSGGTTFGGNWQTYGTTGTGTGQFSGIYGITLDAVHDRLFLSDWGNGRVVAVDSGGSGTTLGAGWVERSELGYLGDLAVDILHNKLFLAQGSTSIFNTEGIVSMDSGTGGTTFGGSRDRTDNVDVHHSFGYLNGLAVDSASNKLYVAGTYQNTRTSRMDSGTGGTSLGNNWEDMNRQGADIVYDGADDRLFVVSDDTHNVFTVDAGSGGTTYGGDYQSFAGYDTAAGQFDSPRNVAFDAINNKVYVADPYNRRVVRMDSGTGGTTLGDNWEAFGNWGTTPQLDNPQDIALDSANNRLYVVDYDYYNGSRIVSLDSGGGGTTFGDNAQATGGLIGPYGIAVDPVNHTLYASDVTNASRLVRMDSGTGGTTLGANLETFGSRGSGTGQFDVPLGLAVDSDNNRLYVADDGNNRIAVVDTGSGGTTFGGGWQEYSGGSDLGSPNDVYLDNANNKLYVSDGSQDRIARIDSGTGGTTLGDNLQTFGSRGSDVGEFSDPSSVAFDAASGRVFVADSGNDRVVSAEFLPAGLQGIHLTKLGADGSYEWTHLAQGDNIYNLDTLVADDAGNAYLAGSFANAVNFDPDASDDTHDAGIYQDIYLTKTNPDGSYDWTHTTQSEDGYVYSANVALTGSNLYLTGDFIGNVNFDPEGEDTHNAGLDYQQAFFTRLDTDGSYEWTKTTAASAYGSVYGPDKVGASTTGDLYASGMLDGGGVDFRQDGGDDVKTTPGQFAHKINADGSYGWTRVALEDKYGGVEITGVETGQDGSVYRVGTYEGFADFNPGASGGKYRAPPTYYDNSFITKTNPDGSYAWTKFIGGGTAIGLTVGADGSVFVGGYFDYAIEFDLDGAREQRTATSYEDTFLAKFSSSGNYDWAYTVGGGNYDEALAVAAAPDGGVYLSGMFSGATDFDPGPGTDEKQVNNYSAMHLTKLGADGSYGWTRVTVDGDLYFYGGDVTIAVAPDGSVYNTGLYYNVADFNPEGGGDTRTSPSDGAYVTKTNPDGSYGWAETYAGIDSDSWAFGVGVTVGPDSNVYTTGIYQGTIDFGPAGGEKTTTGQGAYISKLGADGSRQWLKAMTAADYDSFILPSWMLADFGFGGFAPVYPAAAMAADSDGNAYLLLHVLGNIDFNPEGGGQPYVAQADGDAAVAKFNADGTIGWVKTIKNNGDGFAWGTGLALDDADNAYVSGHYVGTLDFNPEGGGDTRTICTGLGDSGDCGGAFLSSWDSAGTYRWTETTEPSPGGYPTGLALISDLKIVSGEILYAAGLFNGFTDFDPAAGEDSKYGFSYFSTFLPYLSTFLLSNSTTGSGGDVDGDSTINDPPGGSGQNNEPPIPPGPIAEVVGEVPVEAPDLDDFEFDVNLTDGIEVGPGEYKVVVNPPAGSELQLEKVEFYLDGNPTHTATADENGQFVWPWDTTSQPGGTVRVIAYEKNGGTSSKQFFVNVKRTTPPGVAIIQPEEAPPAQEVDTSLLASTERFIKQLPPSLVKSFPYWLFVLLALLALLLFMIAWREAAEVNSIERKLKHDQLLNAQKINFVQLVSHYMRTPVALMRDSASLALALKEGPPAVWQALEKQVASLGQHVEDLLGRVTSIPSVQAPQFAQAPEVRLWKRPSFVVPVVLVGVLAIFTDVLAGLVGDLDISVLNVIGQILVFIIGAAALYMAIRAVTLGRKRRQRLLQAREQEADIDGARNNVLDRSSSLLVPDFGTIKQSSLQVNPGKGANMFAGGVKRFESMLERFDLAKRLGADAPVLHTTELPLRTVLNSATANLRPQIDAKNITIQYPADQTIKTDSDWMVFVLASLIDNAVAYSPQGGTVTIEANDTSISVEDHGSGIEEDKLDFLTQPFARADDVEKFTHEGMGLSLYLDKLVGTQLGYTMDMQSAPERGTKVTLTRVR